MVPSCKGSKRKREGVEAAWETYYISKQKKRGEGGALARTQALGAVLNKKQIGEAIVVGLRIGLVERQIAREFWTVHVTSLCSFGRRPVWVVKQCPIWLKFCQFVGNS